MHVKGYTCINNFFVAAVGCRKPGAEVTTDRESVKAGKKHFKKADTAFARFRIDTTLQFQDFEAVNLYRAKPEQQFFDHTRQLFQHPARDQQLAFTIDSFRFSNKDLYTSLIFRKRTCLATSLLLSKIYHLLQTQVFRH